MYFLFIYFVVFLVKAPTPPNKVKTWSSEGYEKKKNPRYQRSASVGSNVVERSKKHWLGRPITRETTPKPMLDANRYRMIKSKHNPPSASDYQTADGVPFPLKTGILGVQISAAKQTFVIFVNFGLIR